MKKLLSVILALTMLCGTVAIAPFGAVTVDEADTAEVGAQAPEPAEDEGIADTGAEADIADTGATYTSGYYEYTLDDKERATITKYTGAEPNLVIPNELNGKEVVGIGDSVFENKTFITKVSLPDSLKQLGETAFTNTAITSIHIPKSLDIARRMYYEADYKLNDKTYSIPRGPFYLCEKLKTVTFEPGTMEISECLFAGAVGLEEITIPDTVTKIEEEAFMGCLRLRKVNMSDSVTVIEASAFENCINLSDVSLPLALTDIGEKAFTNTAITSIHIPKSLDIARRMYYEADYKLNDKTYSIPRGPFYLCEKLKTVTFEPRTTEISECLFAGAVGLEEITIPYTVTKIEEEAFMGCLRLRKVNMSDSVTVIEASAFENCINLSDVSLPLALTDIGEKAFTNTAITSIHIPKSLDIARRMYYEADYKLNDKTYSIPRGPFYLCEKLKTVTFEPGTTEISQCLFAGAVGLEEITIPYTVTKIEEEAFMGCLRLRKVNMSDSVTVIEDSAFENCINLSDVSLPLALTDLGTKAFTNTAITSIHIPKSLDIARRMYYEADYKLNDKTYSIPRGPFYLCEKLKTVTFEPGTTEISECLFAGAVGLEEITIPDTVTKIEDEAFRGCLRLKKVNIGKGLKSIADYAFMTCASLSDITVPSHVTSIGAYLFDGCESLVSAELQYDFTVLPEYTFYGCASLEDVKLPDSIKTFEKNTFSGCASLKSIDFPKQLTVIGVSAFQNSGLTDLTLAGNITTVNGSAFKGCADLKTVNVCSPVYEIKANSFENCLSLESVTLPASLRTLGTYAFHNCEKLSEVEFADYSITTIEDSTFKDDLALASIDLPKGLKTIGKNAFVNDTGLLAVTIPESVTKIDDSAFSYNKILTIYGITGSEANRFADAKGIRFIDNHVYAEGIALDYEKFGDDEEFTIDIGEWFEPYFELYPLESNDCISLSASNTNVMIDGMLIKGRYNGDSVITATTTGGAECTFTMHVREVKEIQLTGMPEKTEYLTGEALDTTGLEVTVVYKNGDLEVTDDYKITGYDPENNAVQKLTVTYTALSGKNYTKTFDVEVKDAKGHPTGIKVAKLPDKVNYVKRQSLDTTGMKVVETFDSGAEVEISDYTLSGYNALKVGEQTITVKYEDFTDTFTIHVYATEDELPDRPTEATEATEPVTEATEPTEPAHVHNLVLVPEVPATYEADGVRAYYLCEGCGKKYWDGFGLIEVSFDTELIIPKLEPTEPTSPATEEPEEPVYIGDANGDGDVDSVDATIIQRVCTMIKVPYSEEQLMCGDVDGDGSLTTVDATFIQRYSTMLKTPYPIGEIKQ